jgi:hypothetical protein
MVPCYHRVSHLRPKVCRNWAPRCRKIGLVAPSTDRDRASVGFRPIPAPTPKGQTMRPRIALPMLVLSAFACSGDGASPTDLRPEFVDGPCPPSATIATPAPVTKLTQTTSRVYFFIHNNCNNVSSTWNLGSSRTGAVASVAAPSATSLTLAGGATTKVGLTYTTGSAPGTGTVRLSATAVGSDANATAALTVTVTN